jgi:hypothetical protein
MERQTIAKTWLRAESDANAELAGALNNEERHDAVKSYAARINANAANAPKSQATKRPRAHSGWSMIQCSRSRNYFSRHIKT